MIGKVCYLLVCFLVVSSAQCPNNCSNQGKCVDNKCICFNLREGNDCSLEFRFLYKGWKEFFGIYIVFADILMISCITFAIVLIAREISSGSSVKKSISNISIQILILVIFACFVRVIYFTTDAHGILGFMPKAVDGLIWNISLVLWTNGFYLLILYWIEIITLSKLRVSSSLNRLRPAFIVGVVVSCIAIIPLGVWSSVERSFRALFAYYGVLIALAIFLIGFSTFHGIGLLRTIFETSNAVGSKKAYNNFVKRITKLLLTMDLMLIGLIVISAVYIFFARKPFPFIIISIAGRVFEWGANLCVLLFLNIKKPKRSPSSNSLQRNKSSNGESGGESNQTSKDGDEDTNTEKAVDLPAV